MAIYEKLPAQILSHRISWEIRAMYKIFHFVVDRSHTGLQLTLKSLPTLKCKYLYLLVTSPFSMNVCSFVFKTLHSLFCERRMDTKPLMTRYEDLTQLDQLE